MTHQRPSILVAYPFLDGFRKKRVPGSYRSWVLDSGAFSAFASGKVIDLSRFIDDCHELLVSDDPPEVIFALDVIGDPEASARNAERMHAAGVPAVPAFHHGSPWHYLDDLGKRFPRIALGGLVGRGKGGHGLALHRSQRLAFIEQCFARVWPKWIHGFGCVDPMFARRVPFASVDSTTWTFALSRYGMSIVTGSRTVPREGSRSPARVRRIRTEIEAYLRNERDAGLRFGRVLRSHGLHPLRIRLACGGKEMTMLADAYSIGAGA